MLVPTITCVIIQAFLSNLSDELKAKKSLIEYYHVVETDIDAKAENDLVRGHLESSDPEYTIEVLADMAHEFNLIRSRAEEVENDICAAEDRLVQTPQLGMDLVGKAEAFLRQMEGRREKELLLINLKGLAERLQQIVASIEEIKSTDEDGVDLGAIGDAVAKLIVKEGELRSLASKIPDAEEGKEFRERINGELERLTSLVQEMRGRISKAEEIAERRRVLAELFYRQLKALDDQVKEAQQAGSDPERYRSASELEQFITSQFLPLQESFDHLAGQNQGADVEMRGELGRLKTVIDELRKQLEAKLEKLRVHEDALRRINELLSTSEGQFSNIVDSYIEPASAEKGKIDLDSLRAIQSQLNELPYKEPLLLELDSGEWSSHLSLLTERIKVSGFNGEGNILEFIFRAFIRS